MNRAILTCSPSFVQFALHELRRHHSRITQWRELAPGIYHLHTPCAFDKLTLPWRQQTPIYLHHAFPVYKQIALSGTLADLEHLKAVVGRHSAGKLCTVQVRSAVRTRLPYSPTDIQQTLNPQQDSFSTHTPAGQIISILLTCEHEHLQAYVGLSVSAHNLSPWSGGQVPIRECVPNRAGYKLLEALNTFAIRLRAGDHALDLGAAPGAWTTLLRRRGLRVTAVAPAPLYPWLAFDRDVQHVEACAEDYLHECQTTFSLIVNDMKLDAQDSARLMVEYAAHLRGEGIAIMTLKLRGRHRRQVMDHSFRILRRAYKIIRVRQMVSNRSEVTLFLRRNE